MIILQYLPIGKPLKPVDQFIYLGSNILSTESDCIDCGFEQILETAPEKTAVVRSLTPQSRKPSKKVEQDMQVTAWEVRMNS